MANQIQLHLDLEVTAGQEPNLESTFHSAFEPAIRKQTGFADVKLLRLDAVRAGAAPANCTYRLLICFDSEANRQAWVASDDHQRVWPQMESHLTGAKYIAILYVTV